MIRTSLLIIAAATCMAVDGYAESIDEILSKTWQSKKIQPVKRCSDEAFLRRVTLDLIGRIPTLQERQAFLANPDRQKTIDQLLVHERFPRFWSELLTSTLIGYTNEFGSDREVMRLWLERQLAAEKSYAKLVGQMIQSTGQSALDGDANFLVRHYEDAAVQVSRLFLGVRLGCARCHDHPFDRWTQDDYQKLNRFFEATDRQEVAESNLRLVDDRPEVSEDERPRFLTGAVPRTTQWRKELALFVVNSKPFARTMGNRLWYHFMGAGVVDPPGDRNQQNGPSVPELYEYLGQQARANDFKLKPLIREICNSRAYQLSSNISDSSVAQSADGRAERLLYFAAQRAKPLMPEQLFDSTMVAMDRSTSGLERREWIQNRVGESLDEDFSRSWEFRETVQQLMAKVLDDSPDFGDLTIDSIYIRTLGRRPSKAEKEFGEQYRTDDLMFGLLNSNEFVFNH